MIQIHRIYSKTLVKTEDSQKIAMAGFEHFKHLREKYFSNTATLGEIEKLIVFYDSGEFNDADEAEHKTAWNASEHTTEDDQRMYQETYAGIWTRIIQRKNRNEL